MNAGRELDVLIAEKVMGWHRLTTELNDEQLVTVPPDWTDLTTARWWGHDLNELVPHYSTDIAAAWQVVELLDLWVIPHDDRWYAGRESNWSSDCLFMGDGVIDGRLSAFCEADTAPLAICRAALAATVPVPNVLPPWRCRCGLIHEGQIGMCPTGGVALDTR